jgi:phenylalanyl-tRNA synthetase beta chain
VRVLQSWLRKYVAFDLPPERLVEKLGMLGLEVEKTENLAARYAGFVVGKVLSVEKHPGADRLTVCSVKCGKKTYRIVCGAPNVAPAQKVVVGLPGATIPRNQHDPESKPFELRRTSIRGVESEGMICSEFELDLGTDANGILVLPGKTRDGMSLAGYLGLEDVAYEIEVTPNRPDWLSHMGIAREIGIVAGRKASLPRVVLKETGRRTVSAIRVRIHDREGCRRFAVRVVEDVKVGPSPEWMQRDLKGIGLRPVNNIVDATNYVMMETGQPMHAFDLAHLEGGEIHIRQSVEEHPFTTLDGNSVSVRKGATMVCDSTREVSLAGIMGGANSEISEETRSVVLEAAIWNPSGIRRTAKHAGLSTDASYRFERGTDPDVVPYALNRAAQLVAESAGGTVLRGIVDHYPVRTPSRQVPMRIERLNEVLGTKLRSGDAMSALGLVGFTPVRRKGRQRVFKVPGFRVDIREEIDLIEEVARVLGYDAIPEREVTEIPLPREATSHTVAATVREMMVGLGFREVITIPLVDKRLASLGGAPVVDILNPLSSEMNSLRTSLIPGIVGVVARNIRYGNPDLRLFEIGHVFERDAAKGNNLVEGFRETENLAFCLSGLATAGHWSEGTRMCDIYDIKGMVESFLIRLSLDKRRFISYRTSDSLVEDAIAVEINGSRAGYMGKVRSDLLALFDIKQDVLVAELPMGALGSKVRAQYRPFVRFPRVRRDVAFVLDREIPASSVQELLLSATSGLLQKAEVFDLYQGDRLPEGKKSLAFALELVPGDRTLTDAEIDEEVRRVVNSVVRELGAQLRSAPGSP